MGSARGPVSPCVCVCCLFKWRNGWEAGAVFLNGWREEGCLQPGLWRPFVVRENKTKREEDKGRKGGKKKEHEGTEERGRDRGRERESRKLEPVTDNNEVCSVTET